MIVTGVETRLVQLDALTIKIGSMPKFKVSGLFTKVTDDEGHEGWSLVHWNLSNAALKTFIDEALSKLVLKKDPFMTEAIFKDIYNTSNRICFGIPQATAAIDIALWDLVGHATGTPLYKILGGMKRRVQAYASLPFSYKPKATVQAIGVALDLGGFRGVKVRIGESLKKDEAVLREVRDHYPDLAIMADVNSGYSDVRDAIKIAAIAGTHDLHWLEEPLQGCSTSALAKLRARSPVDIAGGENDFDIYRFHDILERGSYDIIQPDVTRNGFTMMKKIEALAEVRGVKVIPHVFGLGHIVAANLAFILASNTGWMEFPFIPDEFQLLQAPIKVKDGFVDAIDKPGLGVAVDAAALDRYSIT